MWNKSRWLTIVLLLAGAGPARDFVTPDGSTVDWEFDGDSAERKAESFNWPATYDFMDVCVIPVHMDVGFWIRVIDAKQKELKLKQVQIHQYTGTVDLGVECNANIELSVSWAKKDGVNLGSYSHTAAVSPSKLVAPGGTVTVRLTLSDVDLRNLLGGTNCLEVGTVTVKVRPDLKPVLASGC